MSCVTAVRSNPIGIDIGPLGEEKFTYHQVNLDNPQALDFLSDQSIDVAHARQFFSSPHLNKLGISPKQLQQNLYPQLERVLKQGSPFIYSD